MAPARKIAKKPKRGPKRVTRPLQCPDRVEPETPPPAAPRPRSYTEALGKLILERMANGETATEICRDPTMPTWSALKRWERDNADFARRYEIARKQCCEYHTDEIIEIADDSRNDYVERVDKRGHTRVVFDRESFERSRLRVDTRKWHASKLLRHVYGEKSEVDVRTPDGLNVRVEERNALIEAIAKLVSPKADGKTKPSGRTEEARER
jgi:hypothetical protein